MYFAYGALLALAAVITFPWFLVQGLRHGKYLGTVRARLGRLPDGAALPRGAIWLHAVSLGELLACQGVIDGLKRRFPARPLVVSTTTETAQRAARERMAAGSLRADAVFFCPFDFGFAVRRVLRRIEPVLLVIAETELWPNLIVATSRAGVPVAVVNARLSDRSFPRYRLFRFFFRGVIRHVSLLLAQSREDARRFCELGIDADRVRYAGNLKYDTGDAAPLPGWLAGQLRAWSAASSSGILLAGSTAAGEEETVIEAFRRLRAARPGLRLILAPRRPERFAEVAALAERNQYRAARRSQMSAEAPLDTGVDVLLLDTVGELAAFYHFATVAFVGGSLVPHGGQNILEAARFARPIVVGPYVHNFRDMVREFAAAGALRQAASAAELAGALDDLFRDEPAAREMGNRARDLAEANRGATARVVDALAVLLEGQSMDAHNVAARQPALPASKEGR